MSFRPVVVCEMILLGMDHLVRILCKMNLSKIPGRTVFSQSQSRKFRGAGYSGELSLKTAMQLFPMKVGSVASYGVPLLWADLTARHMAKLDTVKENPTFRRTS